MERFETETTIGVSDFAPTAETLKGTDEDVAWFKRHQRRFFRIRLATPGEVPSPEATHILAARAEPDVILRLSFASEEPVANTELMGECLWQRWGYAPLSKHGDAVALMFAEAEGRA